MRPRYRFPSVNRAQAEPGYGGHWFATRCSSIQDPDCQCGICDGALGWCVDCGEGEAGLARVCPGERASRTDTLYQVLNLKLTRLRVPV